MDHRSHRELDAPWTAISGITNHGDIVGSCDPIGIYDSIEQVTARAASQRNPRERSSPERSQHVLWPEEHGHVVRW